MLSRLINFALLFHQAVQQGLLLFIAAISSFIVANSHLLHYYYEFFDQIIAINISTKCFSISIHNWINDFLMAFFFLVVGMEIKREIIDGHLKDKDQRILPIMAAITGVILPTLIYYAFNYNNEVAMQGWAIPATTDIAFALSVYALCAKNLPIQMRFFLTALAIIDDLIAVAIIAIFYRGNLDLSYIAYILLCCVFLFLLNRAKISLLTPYLISGIFLWYFVFQSGLHATIAGVILGIFIPLESSNNKSPLKELERGLSIYVKYLILPLFAFSNCGVPLVNICWELICHPVVLGIIFGLFFGKIIGISATVWALVKFKIVKLHDNVRLSHYFLISIFCAIGFTMSLFIGLIAFSHNEDYLSLAKVGIILASLIAIITASTIKPITKKLNINL